MTANDGDEELKVALEKTLNRHGYGFQYAVIRRVGEVLKESNWGSQWAFEVAEFPAAVQQVDTRLDFILRCGSANWYLLAECKRANPALSNWCFVRAPFVARGITGKWIIRERVSADDIGVISCAAQRLTTHSDVYHIGIEVRSNAAGDRHGPGRGAIEDAAGQVSRGLNGVVEWLRVNPKILRDPTGGGFRDMFLTPVIFTTANLWVSNADLKDADVASGELPIRDLPLQPRPWLWLQYNLSPGIKHMAPNPSQPTGFAEALEAQFSRSIAVVSAGGISAFLNWEP